MGSLSMVGRDFLCIGHIRIPTVIDLWGYEMISA